jgi:acetyl-CoA C-acetyltransferase
MNQHAVSEEQAAKVAVKNLKNACRNEYAHRQCPEIQVAEVLDSQPLCLPLKYYDLPIRSDGACALILASERRAKRMSSKIAWIQGLGWCSGEFYHGDYELSGIQSLTIAGRKAYEAAGIKRPLQQLDVVEIHDVSTVHELMIYEGLGFCNVGDGGQFIDDGIPFVEGELPVNASGGILSSNPYTAGGLVRLGEAALQVMGKAKGHQIPEAKVALAHGMTGMRDQGNCVFILSKE